MHAPIFVLRRFAPALLCVSALAQSQGLPPSGAQLQAIGLAWARQAAVAALPVSDAPLRVEVSVGEPDSRLRLAPCAAVEPFAPVGTRLWGRTRVGLRCADGAARWNITLPATVTVFGPAWVLRNPVAMGTTLTPADVVRSEADWTQESAAVLTDAAAWSGQTATRILVAGQTLRQGMVRPAQAFAAGTQVRVLAQGPGFQVAGEGQALTAGVVGQSARVRMDNGRVTSGTVLDVRTILVAL